MRERENCYNILFVFSLEWIFNRIVVNTIFVWFFFFFCVSIVYLLFLSM